MRCQPLIKTQINQIRRAVQIDGESFATCEELRVLCPNEGTFTRQLGRVTEIAQEQGWNFAFLTDGSVRFAARLTSPKLSSSYKRWQIATLAQQKMTTRTAGDMRNATGNGKRAS